jgi:glucose uptake protein GlcU
MPIYFWTLSTAMVVWGDIVERVSLPGSFTLPEWYKMSDFFFIFGLMALVVVILATPMEAAAYERNKTR